MNDYPDVDSDKYQHVLPWPHEYDRECPCVDCAFKGVALAIERLEEAQKLCDQLEAEGHDDPGDFNDGDP